MQRFPIRCDENTGFTGKSKNLFALVGRWVSRCLVEIALSHKMKHSRICVYIEGDSSNRAKPSPALPLKLKYGFHWEVRTTNPKMGGNKRFGNGTILSSKLFNDPKITKKKHIHPSLHEIHFISRSKQGEEELQLQEVPISLHQSLVWFEPLPSFTSHHCTD